MRKNFLSPQLDLEKRQNEPPTLAQLEGGGEEGVIRWTRGLHLDWRDLSH